MDHSGVCSASSLVGSDLTASDSAALDSRGMDRSLAARTKLRRVDALAGAEAIGRKNGNYASILIPPFHLSSDRLRKYRLRRHQPDLGDDSAGNLKARVSSSFLPADRRRASGMVPAGPLLRELHAGLSISDQKRKQAQGIELVRLKREQKNQDLCFSSRPFVLCGLPVRRLPKDQLLYERRNGHFVLQITGHPEFGVPFGQDRLVPIFLATLAVQQKSQVIRFHTAAEMLATFGLSTGGKEYRRLVAAFERIFGATIFFGTDTLTNKAKVVQRSRFNFMSEAQIWYSRHPDNRVLSEEFQNVIVLSEEFYQEITAHPIPNDLEAVKVLAASPAVLDLYMWLSFRCFKAKGEEVIPIFGEYGLASQLGSVEYSRPRRFRAMLEQWLRIIRAMWPECPARLSPDGETLQVKPAVAVHRPMTEG